jgi:hypothetical protein
MTDLAHFENDYISLDSGKVRSWDLWVLDAHTKSIQWCALNAQCGNNTPAWAWFCTDAEAILKEGDIPQALILRPIDPAWISQVMDARIGLEVYRMFPKSFHCFLRVY